MRERTNVVRVVPVLLMFVVVFGQGGVGIFGREDWSHFPGLQRDFGEFHHH